MAREHLKIGFVRRGYSRSGGAESYLTRLVRGLQSLGHEAELITTSEWPEDSEFNRIVRVAGLTPIGFADAVESARRALDCDVLMSLERVWQCDVMRAGDGIHRAWLQRRDLLARVRSVFNPKHRSVLKLEESLYARGGAGRVIANSEMVKREIVSIYGCSQERVDVVYNGVPLEQFWSTTEQRAESRTNFGVSSDDIALLFVGSSWERKGLAVVVRALEQLANRKLRLLIAGRGNERPYRSRYAHFLGEVADVAALYRAGDIFVLPTVYDPFSNACLEALASGLPVITTRTNGFSEAIEEGVHGSVVDGTPDGVANAIRDWSAPQRRHSARPLILERAAQFDISRNVDRTLEVLLRAAADKHIAIARR